MTTFKLVHDRAIITMRLLFVRTLLLLASYTVAKGDFTHQCAKSLKRNLDTSGSTVLDLCELTWGETILRTATLKKSLAFNFSKLAEFESISDSVTDPMYLNTTKGLCVG